MLEANCSQSFVTSPGRTLFNTSDLLEQVRHCRCLGSEAERAVWLNNDGTRDRYTRIDVSCSGVELFAKVHRLYAFGTKCRANGWRRRSFPSANHESLQAMDSENKKNTSLGVEGRVVITLLPPEMVWALPSFRWEKTEKTFRTLGICLLRVGRNSDNPQIWLLVPLCFSFS